MSDQLIELLQDTKENKEQIFNVLKENLQASIQSEQQFAHFLDLMSKSKGYSFRNRLLLSSQYSNISIVKSYGEWKKLGYAVKRGAKALKVITPSKLTVYLVKDNGKKIWKSASRLTEEQRTNIKQLESKSITSFSIKAQAFDIGQTNYPINQNPLLIVSETFSGEEPEEQLKQFTEFVQSKDINVEFRDVSLVDGAFHGEYELNSNTITVSNLGDYKSQLSILIHEYAHAYLNHPMQLKVVPKEVMEIQAESVSYIIMKRLGLSNEQYSFMYLNHFSSSEYKELESSMNTILETSDIIFSQFSEYMGVSSSIEEKGSSEQLSSELNAIEETPVSDAFLNDDINLVDEEHIDHLKQLTQRYHKFLKAESLNSLDYLSFVDKRQINTMLAREFDLGYAPDFKKQIDYLKQFIIEDLEAAGLAYQNAEGAIIPHFVNRVMFPIKNEMGEIVGFSGRDVSPAGEYAKYKNSPETDLFKKTSILYNVNKYIGKSPSGLYLTEGYMDTIALESQGLPSVAIMGTSLTKKQINLLKATGTDYIILSLDGDIPGQNATAKVLEQLRPHFQVSILDLKGLDPDEAVHQWNDFIAEAIPGCIKNESEWKIDYYRSAASFEHANQLDSDRQFVLSCFRDENVKIDHDALLKIQSLSNFRMETLQSQLVKERPEKPILVQEPASVEPIVQTKQQEQVSISGDQDVHISVNEVEGMLPVRITSFFYNNNQGTGHFNLQYGNVYLNDLTVRNSKDGKSFWIAEPSKRLVNGDYLSQYKLDHNSKVIDLVKSQVFGLMKTQLDAKDIKVCYIDEPIPVLIRKNQIRSDTVGCAFEYGDVSINDTLIKTVPSEELGIKTFVNLPKRALGDNTYKDVVVAKKEFKEIIIDLVQDETIQEGQVQMSLEENVMKQSQVLR